MKRLNPIDDQDEQRLRALALDADLSSHPHLQNNLLAIIGSYEAYEAVSGNAKHANCPTALGLPLVLAKALKGHYAQPPVAIQPFLENLRTRSSPDVCSMCGSPKAGTLDHVFPKTAYPEFAIFGMNLVPACDCNTKHGADFRGPRDGERVLHPYFDDVLRERLVRCQIQPVLNGGFERPTITLQTVLRPDHQNFAAASYHVANLLSKTDVLSHCDTTWPKYCNRPGDYFHLPVGPINDQQMLAAVQDKLAREDRHYGTMNNWHSMLLAGVEANAAAITFLCQRTNAIRTAAYVPPQL